MTQSMLVAGGKGNEELRKHLRIVEDCVIEVLTYGHPSNSGNIDRQELDALLAANERLRIFVTLQDVTQRNSEATK